MTVVGFFTPLVFVVALTVALTAVVSAFFTFAPAADFLRGAFVAAFKFVITFLLDTRFFAGVGVALVAVDFSAGFDFGAFFAEVSALAFGCALTFVLAFSVLFAATLFLADTFFAGAFLTGAFLATAFLAGAFLTGAFLTAVFLAVAFFAGAFLAVAFFAGAFLTGAFFTAFFTAGFLTALFLTGLFLTAAFFLTVFVSTARLLLAGLFFTAAFFAGLFVFTALEAAFVFAAVFAFGFVLAACLALAFALAGAFVGVFALALAFFTGAFLLFAAIVFFRLSLWTNALGKSSSERYQNIRLTPSINFAHFACLQAGMKVDVCPEIAASDVIFEISAQ